jgi:elongator complex protein 1
MPRGNLEGVCPRLLLLHKIKSLIVANEYRKAYEILRQQKIDLNMIFDVDVEGFMQKTEKIAEMIDKVDFLNLFLTNIKDDLNEDLEYILNPDELKKNKEAFAKLTIAANLTKTRLVCDAMIKSLSKIDRDRYILTIMTGHIKMNELEIVLNQIIKMKEDSHDETEVKVPPHLNPESKNFFSFSKI